MTMKKICSWLLVAATVGLLAGCAGMSTSMNESTTVDEVSFSE